MWELDHKEGWVPKNWCFWTVVLEKTLESPLDCKEIKPVNPKGNQPWIFIGRTDAEAEAPIIWPPDGKSWLIGKDPDTGKYWGHEKKGVTEVEMGRWHHQLNGHEFEQTPGDGEGQESKACCSTWGHKESDTTEQLNNTSRCVDSAMIKYVGSLCIWYDVMHIIPYFVASSPNPWPSLIKRKHQRNPRGGTFYYRSSSTTYNFHSSLFPIRT